MADLPLFHGGRDLPQIIPSTTCLSCEVCCRFPEKESFLAPFFTDEEVERAIAHGVDREHFKKRGDNRATQVELVPNGEGYICPAFNPGTHECRIYTVRPLDCQIYPFVVMKGKNEFELCLGIDQKCPFFLKEKLNKEMRPAVQILLSRIEGGEFFSMYQKYPELIGPFQDDVWVFQRLPRLSSKLRHQTHPSLFNVVKPLSVEHLPILEQYLKIFPCMLSSWAPSAIFLWKDFFRYYWAVIDGCFCLFAECDGYLFMPLPPIGENCGEKAVMESLALMEEINGPSGVTRIENIPELLLPIYQKLDLCLYEKPHEYIYDRQTLVQLQGNRFKSKRSEYNHFTHYHFPQIEDLTQHHADDCIDLFLEWKSQKEKRNPDTFQQGLLQDALHMHQKAFTLWETLNFKGMLVRVNGLIKAYTFGVPLGEDGFCIQAEVQDPHLKGISTFIFREFCRSLEGYAWINTMEDLEMETLRAVKESYRPILKPRSFTAQLKK